VNFSTVTKAEAISDCDSGGAQAVMFRTTSFEAANKEFAAASACRAAEPQRPEGGEVAYRCIIQRISTDVLLIRDPNSSSSAVATPD
jgi:hypothetical protein